MASCDSIKFNHESNPQKEFDMYMLKLRKGKKQEIYDLIEEPILVEPKKQNAKQIKKSNKTKNLKLFEGRNIIKKVKTHGLKLFNRILKQIANLKEKIPAKFRLKLQEKKYIYKIFKSDISKFRNKILLNHKMKTIMKNFSNLNLHEGTKIKDDKKEYYDFLMNSTWLEILIYFKRKSKEIILNDVKPGKNIEITSKEVNEYLDYIKNGSSNYKERVNLDKNYLKLYEPIVSMNPESSYQESMSFHQEVFDMICKHNCYS
jgi:hypothetical protein